ncbi:hypothetical protein SDC9_159974 [bioreactor metagenome]|uniref:Uncharacterized protein n=1 Tax=bioreactor metagenome TaxID=1076179 RepID=A0A645FE30_9ZZZZ
MWNPLLRDIQARNDLDPGCDLFLEDQRRLSDLSQDAVRPDADAVILFVRFEMNVRGALIDGVDQDFLDEFDNGGVVDFVTAVFACLFGWTVLLQQVHVKVFAGQVL